MKIRIFSMSLILFVVLLTGCATSLPPTTCTITITGEDVIEKTVLIDTITMVLIDNGFDIETINDTYGLIQTKWKEMETTWGDIGLSLLTSSEATTKSYNSALMLTFRLIDNGYVVVPKATRIEQSSGWFSSTSKKGNTTSPTEDSNLGKLTNKIINEINNHLGIKSEIVWGKEISSLE